MSEPTKDAPFEYEGVKVYAVTLGSLTSWAVKPAADDVVYLAPQEFRAIAAYLATLPDPNPPLADWERELLDVSSKALGAALDAALAPVDDGVFRWHGYEVRPLGNGGSVVVVGAPPSWTFADRRAVENVLGNPDVVAAALAFYDAQTPALERMSEPGEMGAKVTAVLTCRRLPLVRIPAKAPGQRRVWSDGHERYRWSDLIDPEPYAPDGAK